MPIFGKTWKIKMAIEGNSPLDQKGHGRESDGRTHNDAAIRNSLDIAKDL